MTINFSSQGFDTDLEPLIPEDFWKKSYYVSQISLPSPELFEPNTHKLYLLLALVKKMFAKVWKRIKPKQQKWQRRDNNSKSKPDRIKRMIKNMHTVSLKIPDKTKVAAG